MLAKIAKPRTGHQPTRSTEDRLMAGVTAFQSLSELDRTTWRAHSSRKTLYSQGTQTIRDMTLTGKRPEDTLLSAIMDPNAISQAVDRWHARGLSQATINKRLGVLSQMGADVSGYRHRPKPSLKWWLKPDAQSRLVTWLRDVRKHSLMAMYVDFICFTGLRVEEALALKVGDFNDSYTEVTVPGLKTVSAQATLPLAPEATKIVRDVLDSKPCIPLIFGMSYKELRQTWEECREFLGEQGNPTATLKALRRSAARYLHVQRGMPLDVLRQYLRHEDIATTMEYLRLTGGYNTDEMRRWL